MFELGSIGGNKMDAAAALRQPPPAIRSHNSTVKNVMRLLRRSHSASHASHTIPMEKFLIDPVQNHHHHHIHHHFNHDNLLEEPRIVNCLEGLPFVMKNKKKVVSYLFFFIYGEMVLKRYAPVEYAHSFSFE